MKLILLAVLLAVAQATPPVPRKTSDNPAGASRTTQQYASPKNQQTAPSSPLVEKTHPVENAKPGEQVRHEDTGNTVRVRELPPVSVTKDWADWGYWAFGLILTIVGGLQVRFLGKTLIAIKRQADLMERQTDLLVDKERPRIFVKPSSFEPVEGAFGTQKVSYTVECLCPTPAFIRLAVAEAVITAGTLKIITLPIDIPATITTTKNYGFQAPILEHISKAIFDKVISREIDIHFKGFIEYRGIHLSEKSASYITPFHYEWIHFLGGKAGWWEKCGPPEDNQET